MTAEEILIAALRAPSYVPVRRRVLRQLIASLVYEGLLIPRRASNLAGQADAPELTEPTEATEPAEWVVDGRDPSGLRVEYRFTMRRGYGFHRVRLTDAPVIRRVSGCSGVDGGGSGSSGGQEVESLTRFLCEVADQLGAAPERVEGFARELEETVLKDAVAQYLRAERGGKLAGADYDALESLVADGHPYHPAYKSRIGFTTADNLAWGPEFDTDTRPVDTDVRPIWLAARGPAVTVGVVGEHTPDQLLRRELGDVYHEFTARIRDAGQDPAGYTLLPVHPWQWRTTVAHAHADALRSGDLIVVGTDPHAHRVQQSIRTLSNRDVPQRASLKLALSLLNTSTGRTLAPHTVRNAPLITGWLRKIVADDPYLRDELRLVLLGEVMGVSVEPEPEPASEAARARTYGTLACIWREPLHGRLDPGEQAIPFTGLIAREVDGTPLIDPWVRLHGLTAWLRQLLTVSVLPLVHLLQRHGIAFESHAQNMILAHRNGVPTRVVLRDFHDGVRFSRAALARPELCPPLVEPPAYHTNRNSFLETDDLDQVADFLLDAFFFINLGEFALFLGEAYDLPEESFWALVREVIGEYQTEHGGKGAFDIGKPRLDVEQLTARRLLPDTEMRVHSVPNPLCPEA